MSGLSQLGLGVSTQTIAFMTALVAGAGTDYAVFLISRYHDYCGSVRIRSSRDEGSDVHGQGDRGLRGHRCRHVPRDDLRPIGIVLDDRTRAGSCGRGRFPRRGDDVACRPRARRTPWMDRATARPHHSLLAAIRNTHRAPAEGASGRQLAGPYHPGRLRHAWPNFNYDDRKNLPASGESNLGYAAMDRHFPLNSTIPQYLFITSPHDLRTPKALADLEQMAQRVSQLPGIEMVRGVTRPTGESLEQAKPPIRQARSAAGSTTRRDRSPTTTATSTSSPAAPTTLPTVSAMSAADQSSRRRRQRPGRRAFVSREQLRRRQDLRPDRRRGPLSSQHARARRRASA